MSRVIKFRAWHKKDKWMESGDDLYIRADGAIFEPAKRTYDTPNAEIESSDDFILMQFTGLYDVNGVEIYESDVVEVPYFDPMGNLHGDTSDYTTDVVFGRGCFLIHSSHLRAERCTIDNLIESRDGPYVSNYGNIREWGKCYLKVIGNIYQNPDLLEAKP